MDAIRGRLGYSDGPRYHQIESLGDALGAIKTRGGRLRQRIIAGSIISCVLVLLFVVFSPSESIQSLRQESIGKLLNSGSKTDATIEDAIWQSTQPTCAEYPETIQVSILETVVAHDEVDAALVHSLASQPNVNLTLYQKRPRFGSEKIIDAFDLDIAGPYNPDTFFQSDDDGTPATAPDVLVLTTCELAWRKAPKRLNALLEKGQTRLICIVHHADHWREAEKKNNIYPWLQANLAEFWTLSPHTATFLSNVTSSWQNLTSSPKIRVFVPVFPVTVSNSTTQQEKHQQQNQQQDLSFAIQGDYDPHRRDYKTIFSRLSTFLQTHSTKTATLHLLGQGTRPNVPSSIAPHVLFDQNLSYLDFYSVISRASALLPGFASKEYLDRKASSSVPAALIAGTPLVATKSVLEAYGYLDEEAVWLQGEGETEFDVVGRVLEVSVEEREVKSRRVRQNRDAIIEGNKKKAAMWVGEAVGELYCDGK